MNSRTGRRSASKPLLSGLLLMIAGLSGVGTHPAQAAAVVALNYFSGGLLRYDAESGAPLGDTAGLLYEEASLWVDRMEVST